MNWGKEGFNQKFDPQMSPPPSLAPTISAAQDLLQLERAALFGKRKKRTRLSSLITGPEGAGLPMTASKMLLGE